MIAERRYLDGLVAVARADGEVDAEEYADLKRVATALGLDIERVNRATEAERSKRALVELRCLRERNFEQRVARRREIRNDAVQRRVHRGMVPDARDRALGVAKVAFEAGFMQCTA